MSELPKMGRKRKPENQWMPPNVSFKKDRYVLSGYQGIKNGKRVFGKEITLCKKDASRAEVWKRYEEVQGISTALTLKNLLDQFNNSEHYRNLSPRTQKDYERYNAIIVNKKLRAGTFGQMLVENITPGTLRKYLDRRAKEDAPKAGNKEVGYISSAYSWAYQRDKVTGINPCNDVTRNSAPPRQHYIEDQDYYAFLMTDDTPAYLNIVIELCYLCRLRKNEALKLTRSNITEEGLNVARGKGSKGSLIPWSNRLTVVIDQCRKLPLEITPLHPDNLPLVHDKRGMAITIGAFDSAWKRRMKRFAGVPFTPHDLKRKSVSDFDGDRLKASGHRDPKMLRVYDVKPETVKPTR